MQSISDLNTPNDSCHVTLLDSIDYCPMTSSMTSGKSKKPSKFRVFTLQVGIAQNLPPNVGSETFSKDALSSITSVPEESQKKPPYMQAG